MNIITKIFKRNHIVKSPKFIKKYNNPNGTYEVYRGASAESAKTFLATKEVHQKLYYVKVETPEGTWGKDLDGLYLEQLVPFQKKISLANCDGTICEMPSFSGLQYAYKGITDNFVAKVKCGNCNHEWDDGVMYKKPTIVRCPNCHKYNKVDSSPHISVTGGILRFKI